ncbi:protein kinase family protein [Antribacter gilvus]|uniref:protein kinase family protein n=1 Tax=Antribacter gilvus TaxID=2304675 RepID=UPI000F782071|nr:protein kinase family protein [Antribacter gilvus]
MSTVEPGAVLVERYRLIRPAPTDLAAAAVWEAEDQVLGRAVRITFVSGPYAADALDSARRAALVSDPRLARVLDVSTMDAARPYVITEPFSGLSLTEIVGGGLVDAQQARALVGEAATALAAAHQRGVHHLALRPESVRVDGHRVIVTGLGLDGGLASGDTLNAYPDAHGLVALLYYAMTARWPGIDLEASWLTRTTAPPLPAQRDEHGAVVPLSSLVPHADTALDALVARTFDASGGASGPKTPDDVITALAPWGEVSVVASLPGFVQPNPEEPQRHSIAGAFGAEGTPPVRRPSTGRIARNTGTGAVPAAGWAAQAPQAQGYPQDDYQYQPEQNTGAGYGGHTPVPPPPGPQYAAPGYDQQYAQQGYGQQGYAPPTPEQQGYPQQYPQGYDPAAYAAAGQAGYGGYQDPNGGFETQPAPRRGGVNPTPIVLSIVGVGVVAGLIWAISNAMDDTTPPITEAQPTVSSSAAPGESGASAPAGGGDAPVADARPVIESSEAVDPLGGEGTGGVYPEKAELATDSDPSTFWHTTSYKRPEFGGFKAGVGYVVHLQEPAPMSKVQLLTNSNGGAFEVRNTTADDPAGGTVLASGTFSPDTQVAFSGEVVTDTIVIWITQLPESPSQDDLKFRLELNEVVLS